MNLLYLNNSSKWVPNVVLYWVVGQWMSFAMEALMQDEMNKTSSHIKLLDQFHIKQSYLVMLSCFMNKVKFRSLCWGFHFDGLLITGKSSHVDLSKWDDDRPHKGCKLLKLDGSKVYEVLEQCRGGLHCGQHISNTNG
jgi:hypothetical protein